MRCTLNIAAQRGNHLPPEALSLQSAASAAPRHSRSYNRRQRVTCTQFATRRRQILMGTAIVSSAAVLAANGGQTAGDALAANAGTRKKPAPAPSSSTDLTHQCAYWLTADLIAWPGAKQPEGTVYRLLSSADGSLRVHDDLIAGRYEQLPLKVETGDLPKATRRKFPHLAELPLLRLSAEAAEKVPAILRTQCVLVAERDGIPQAATGLQLPGVLDELFNYEGPLGVEMKTTGEFSLHLWAPTAAQVELLVHSAARGGDTEKLPMHRNDKGVWHASGPSSWRMKYYTYRIRVYHASTQQFEVSEATDPYSVALAADGLRSQFVTLSEEESMPAGWRDHSSPPLAALTDSSFYELHVRDFSATDESVPEHLRGKYGAFDIDGTTGRAALEQLQQAGLTHLHLLPTYDFATVPERAEDLQAPQGDLRSWLPDSEKQQAAVAAVAQKDAFNWGYDPVHYSTPEGSYAMDVDGVGRTLEMRQMVAALHSIGLRVVLDVVYNHTFHSGPHSMYSVLDKVVPGYYHRLETDGSVCGSAFGANNAPEHAMMERLVIDDLCHWAIQYKVDGFRFDIMSCLMISTMEKARDRLRNLTLERHGVDGAKLVLYGEGWEFGEVAGNQRGRNAAQLNLGGTGIASFNDRLRDAILGGSPFAPSRDQGFVNGLALQPNSCTADNMSTEDQQELLGTLTDAIMVSLAANLRTFPLEDHNGRKVTGKQVLYGGSQPAGYAQQPVETINYCSCHDGEILFDQLIMKPADEVDVEQRARMATLAQYMVALAQGLPFFHAGDELLRSKSLDRDSYDSGDHFNHLDWTGSGNNFGVGLPMAAKNGDDWIQKRPFLARQELQPGGELIRRTREAFLASLRIRYSSPLFRLPTAAAVERQLRFHNTGRDQVKGVIVMELVSGDELTDGSGGVRDDNFVRLVVVFNSRPEEYHLSWPPGARDLIPHPEMPAWALHGASESSPESKGKPISDGAQTTRELATWVPARAALVLVQYR